MKNSLLLSNIENRMLSPITPGNKSKRVASVDLAEFKKSFDQFIAFLRRRICGTQSKRIYRARLVSAGVERQSAFAEVKAALSAKARTILSEHVLSQLTSRGFL